MPYQATTGTYNYVTVAGTAGANAVKNDCRRYSRTPFSVNCTVPDNSEALGYEHGVLRLTAPTLTARSP